MLGYQYQQNPALYLLTLQFFTLTTLLFSKWIICQPVYHVPTLGLRYISSFPIYFQLVWFLTSYVCLSLLQPRFLISWALQTWLRQVVLSTLEFIILFEDGDFPSSEKKGILYDKFWNKLPASVITAPSAKICKKRFEKVFPHRSIHW